MRTLLFSPQRVTVYSQFRLFSTTKDTSIRATQAIIHLNNLRHNIRLIRKMVGPKVLICPAVKANAYGHGAVRIAQVLLQEGVERLCVATVGEGQELRASGINVPILLLSIAHPSEISALVSADLTPLVTDREYIELLQDAASQQNKTLCVHLKVDVGMGRLGCQPESAIELSRLITHQLHLDFEGICTHFPSADNGQQTPTKEQILRFQQTVDAVKSAGYHPRITHAANSGAIIDFPQSHFDMVRPGIILYGYPPSPAVSGDFRPVMELQSFVSFLKRPPQGSGLSYSSTYTTPGEHWVATVSIGYADGYSRSLSNRGPVRIGGKNYQISGRVCMDQFLIDLGAETQVKRWDPVTLFGPQGPTAQDLADLQGTIPYEITCLISSRVPRIYVDEPKA